jgi:iron complex transport system substrate-binding protein
MATQPMLARLLRSLALFACCIGLGHAEISLRDDSGATLRLAQPARRIVGLAPHVTETLFAAGAGDRLVGAVDYSDYPEAARRLPRVGSHAQLDLEAIVALKPDLAVGWASGNSLAHVAKLRALGIPVFLVEPARIDDIAPGIERLGRLAGTESAARAAATALRERLQALRARHGARPTVRTFYEIWQQPLTTVGGTQIIGDVIRLCGGENVFAGLGALAPRLSVEAVLAADPEAIVASGMDEARPEWLDDWRRWDRHDGSEARQPSSCRRTSSSGRRRASVEGAELLCAHPRRAPSSSVRHRRLASRANIARTMAITEPSLGGFPAFSNR